jgi:hypothetical protein
VHQKVWIESASKYSRLIKSAGKIDGLSPKKKENVISALGACHLVSPWVIPLHPNRHLDLNLTVVPPV